MHDRQEWFQAEWAGSAALLSGFGPAGHCRAPALDLHVKHLSHAREDVTPGCDSALPRHTSRPGDASSRPSISKRAQGMPVHERTRSLACKSKKHASKSPQARRNIRHSLYDGFAAYTRSPRCPGLLATVVCGFVTRKRDPSVGGSGPHDFAARFKPRSSRAAQSVHRIPRPTSVTIAIRPSLRARDGRA
jgi:hypothetical protein